MRCLAGLGLVVLAGGLLASGCDVERTLKHRRDPTALVVARATGTISLDPLLVTDSESLEVAGLLFEGLVRWKRGTTEVVPGLATSWTVSPDSLRWRFVIRPGVTFHDGTALDPAAVVFSFDRLLDPKHPHYVGPAGAYWRALLKDVTDVVALDASTVEIHIARPYAPLLADLARFPIVSPTAVVHHGDAFKVNPVGTGPFELETWSPGAYVVTRRNPAYWDTKPQLERIVFRVVADDRQRVVDLESGSVDIATPVLPDEQPFVELHPDLDLHLAPANDVTYLAFNLERPPFDDVRVRRAVSHAINKLPIVKLAFQGRAVAADSPLPPTQWGHHTPRITYEFDPARARALLAEAAADHRFDPNATFKLYAPSTPRAYLSQPERVARLIQSALTQVGIKTELVLQPYAAHRASINAGAHDLALFGWIGETGDPDNFLYVLFHSDGATRGSANNIAFYRNPGVDSLLAQAQATRDVPTRSGLYAAIQDQIADDAPWVPLAHSELVIAARAEIGDVLMSPLGHPIYTLIRRGRASR
ncbi:MAG: ABC transporter substrate-binding protein [Kofleriaceae bacterium]